MLLRQQGAASPAKNRITRRFKPAVIRKVIRSVLRLVPILPGTNRNDNCNKLSILRDLRYRWVILEYGIGGGAGNRTPVRQGPTTSFSVRSLRFYVGSGLPETGCPHPSTLGLDLAFESITRGAVAIGDVRRESWRRKLPGTWTLFKRPVRNFRWQLLFAPCFTSSGNSARCP